MRWIEGGQEILTELVGGWRSRAEARRTPWCSLRHHQSRRCPHKPYCTPRVCVFSTCYTRDDTPLSARAS